MRDRGDSRLLTSHLTPSTCEDARNRVHSRPECAQGPRRGEKMRKVITCVRKKVIVLIAFPFFPGKSGGRTNRSTRMPLVYARKVAFWHSRRNSPGKRGVRPDRKSPRGATFR